MEMCPFTMILDTCLNEWKMYGILSKTEFESDLYDF